MSRNARSEFERFCVFLLAASVLNSCHPQDEAEIRGTYAANHSAASETPSLREDGTFLQVIIPRESDKVDSAIGTWSYNPKMGYITFDSSFLNFTGPVGVYDSLHMLPKSGITGLRVDNYFGRITIGVSEGTVYRKLQR